MSRLQTVRENWTDITTKLLKAAIAKIEGGIKTVRAEEKQRDVVIRDRKEVDGKVYYEVNAKEAQLAKEKAGTYQQRLCCTSEAPYLADEISITHVQ